MKIVAIGGGENGIKPGSTYDLEKIDREVVAMTDKPHPTMLYIGVNIRCNYAFGVMKKNYMKLGAQCIYLKYEEFSNKKTVESKFKRADIIYIGGGNTLEYMLKIKKFGIEKYIANAIDRNVVVAGISAGAICICKCGCSDARKYKDNLNKYTKVSGLGFVDIMFAPHFTGSNRKQDLPRMLKNCNLPAICVDNQAALVVDGDKYRIVRDNANAKAYKCFCNGSKFVFRELETVGKLNELILKQ